MQLRMGASIQVKVNLIKFNLKKKKKCFVFIRIYLNRYLTKFVGSPVLLAFFNWNKLFVHHLVVSPMHLNHVLVKKSKTYRKFQFKFMQFKWCCEAIIAKNMSNDQFHCVNSIAITCLVKGQSKRVRNNRLWL